MDRSDVSDQRNMAEAAVESPAARFFCHRCSVEINPLLPDYICPQCQGGFIEEVAQNTEPNEESDEEVYNALGNVADVAQVSELWNMLSYIRRPDEPTPNFIQSAFGAPSQNRDEYRARPGPSRRIRYPRVPSRRNADTDTARNRTEGFLQQLVTTLSENTGLVTNAGFPVFLNLHSNPGDYAWGRGGWNAIINQLINQLDGTGPPPLPKEKIDEIPSVNISQEQVDKNLQCTVCMEDFILEEPVRRLACDHHFHDGCIIPWLELHGTCPICRKLLNDSSSQENVFTTPNLSDMVELPGMTSATQSSSQNSSTMSASESDTVSSRSNDSYNPHQPSVYDFTEEFD